MKTPNSGDQPPWPGWPDPPKVERDEKGRFKKGSTGNLFGRPVKMTRAVSKRGFRREMLAELQRTINVGGEEITVSQLILRQLLASSSKGNLKATEKLLELYYQTLDFLERENADAQDTLEFVERRYAQLHPDELNNDQRRYINETREKAKRL